MRNKLILAAVIILTFVSMTSCTFVTTQAELNRAKKAQKKAEEELSKTKKELKSVRAELAELKKQYAESAKEGETAAEEEGAYTPPKGSAERKAILDAIRRSPCVRKNWLFIVHHLKVKDNWAYAIVEPYDPPNRYELGNFLLRKKAGVWNVIKMVDYTEVEETGLTAEGWLQKKYPDAPPEIFK